jgi:hypothetical protein
MQQNSDATARARIGAPCRDGRSVNGFIPLLMKIRGGEFFLPGDGIKRAQARLSSMQTKEINAL